MNKKEIVNNYLINHKELLNNKYKKYLQQKEEMIKYEKEDVQKAIEKQAKDVFIWSIAKEVSKNTTVTIEDALIVIEDLNIDEVFNESFLQ